MTVRIDAKKFSGASHVYDGDLSAALRELSIANAKRVMVTAAVAAITDNGGGAGANGTIEAITLPPAFTEVGTASAQKAEFETALGLVKDALTEVGTKLEEVVAILPAVDFTDSSGGTAADGTIAVMDVSMTAVATSIAAYAGATTRCTAIRNAIATMANATNLVRAAVGLSAIVDSSGGTPTLPRVVAALSTDTGTAVDGTALSGISKTGADAFLAACAAAVKELSTAVNAVSAVTAPATTTVVAI